MTQNERLIWLINYLLNEDVRYKKVQIPYDKAERFNLYRSLVNVRMPAPVSDEYLKIEDEFLQQVTREKGITDFESLTPIDGDIYLWRGDITTLKCDAIVNAANSQLLGCFCPCHCCIDNCIHTFAGIRLRQKCNEIMINEHRPQITGGAKVTPAYNLPSKLVIHTVGPIIDSTPDYVQCSQLGQCYETCLKFAEIGKAKSIAFCCISTGEFHFPNELAAQIAIDTVKKYKSEKNSDIKVIFNVFKEQDFNIYKRKLTK